jgi:hypothetical protein
MSFRERRCRASRLVPFAVATGLLMGGAGGATAVADPGSSGSTGHGQSGAGGSGQASSSVGSRAGNPAGSVAGTLRTTVRQVTSAFGSGRNPGQQASSGATTQIGQIGLRGTDNTQGKHNAGLAAAVPNVVASVPNVVAAVPNAVAPILNLGTPVTNVVPSVPNLVTPVTNVVPSVPSLLTLVTNAVGVSVPSAGASGPNAIAAVQNTLTSTDPDFISHTTNFGLFTNTSAADPDDHEFVATVFQSPFATDILTSGADPSGSLGFGQTGVGVPGKTVNTLQSPVFPFLDSTFALPFTDPLAPLFTALIPFGF